MTRAMVGVNGSIEDAEPWSEKREDCADPEEEACDGIEELALDLGAGGGRGDESVLDALEFGGGDLPEPEVEPAVDAEP